MDPGPHPELPVKLHPCSNGEYVPPPMSSFTREVIRRASALVDTNARRTGLSRRQFLLSSCASASTLAVLAACSSETSNGSGGGTFTVPTEATLEPDAADEVIGGDEFIFDVQTHSLDYPAGSVADYPRFPQAECGDDPRACLGSDQLLDLMFNQSDTDVAMLSGVPFPGDLLSPVTMASIIALADSLCGDGRVLMQAYTSPSVGELSSMLDGMDAVAAGFPLRAWKVYTHVGGPGWWLDDHDPDAPQVGNAFLERAGELGPRIVAVHKGFGFGRTRTDPVAYTDRAENFESPVDVGPAAVAHPDLSFVVYHSAFDVIAPEGPYSPASTEGVDRLITSLDDAGIGPGENVYAEIGSTWRTVMGDPDGAAHVIGKLLVAFGEDNVTWGSDSLWYGSPQDQIEAFRAFEITPEFQERFGYPALTDAVKAKIFGLNSAAIYGVEPLDAACGFSSEELVEARAASPVANRTLGPTTAREVAAINAAGEPWEWTEGRT